MATPTLAVINNKESIESKLSATILKLLDKLENSSPQEVICYATAIELLVSSKHMIENK